MLQIASLCSRDSGQSFQSMHIIIHPRHNPHTNSTVIFAQLKVPDSLCHALLLDSRPQPPASYQCNINIIITIILALIL